MAETTPSGVGSQGWQPGTEASAPSGIQYGSQAPPPPPVAMPGDAAQDDWNEPPSIAGPIFVAGLASALLGAVLALGILAWVNGGLKYAEADTDMSELRSRMADLDGQLEDMEERAAAGAANDAPSGDQSDGGGSSPAVSGSSDTPTEEPAAESEESTSEDMATHEPSRTPKPTATRRPTSTPRSR